MRRKGAHRTGAGWPAAATALAVLGGARAAEACAVCYGAADSAMTAGMNNAILLLLAVVAVVQIGFVGLFVSFWKRARRLRQREGRLQLIEGGAP